MNTIVVTRDPAKNPMANAPLALPVMMFSRVSVVSRSIVMRMVVLCAEDRHQLMTAAENQHVECWYFLPHLPSALVAPQYVIDTLSTPQSLEDICVARIRRALRGHVWVRIDLLQLPKQLTRKMKLLTH